MTSPQVEKLTGEAIGDVISDLARLRIEVFRAFPYLYDGSAAYEEKYLQTYLDTPEAAVFIARDNGVIVGASTALPLQAEAENLQRPFLQANMDPGSYFYFGESVLLKAYRGRGVGVRFFHEREAHARELGNYSMACFCAVDRPANHPLRPIDYQPLDEFWKKRGYQKTNLRTEFSWQDIDQPTETSKTMIFWTRSLQA